MPEGPSSAGNGDSSDERRHLARADAPCSSATRARRRCATSSRKRSTRTRTIPRPTRRATCRRSSARCCATCSISASATPAMSACRARTSSRSRKSTSFADLVQLFAEAGHSRLPVYRDELDTIIGMVHIKDVFAILATRRAASRRRIAGADPPAALRAAVVGALDLLAEMRASARPSRDRARRIFGHRGPGHDRGSDRGDRRRDRGRA